MNLVIQIEVIIFSFLLGFLTFLVKSQLRKILCHNNKVIKIIANVILVEVITIIYIKGLFMINNLAIHFYSLFFLILGFFLPLFYLKSCKH